MVERGAPPSRRKETRAGIRYPTPVAISYARVAVVPALGDLSKSLPISGHWWFSTDGATVYMVQAKDADVDVTGLAAGMNRFPVGPIPMLFDIVGNYSVRNLTGQDVFLFLSIAAQARGVPE